MGLLLRAVEVADRHRWRWLLEDAGSGEPLADHQVALNPAARGVRAFEDLPRYLRWRADPDRRVESEAHLLTQVGAWLGARVLGERVGARIVERAPVTVRVRVPPEAEFLLLRPLELAHVDGVPLAARGDVSLVYEVEAPARGKPPVGERLRMLAVFSLPTESTALGLRRERYALGRLIRRLAARRGLAVDLEVLQYGVTRERLARALVAGGGPEVLHISGHGTAGGLLLERADGRTDLVSAEELLTLLRPARERVRLAVVSACESAAARVAQTLGLLGLAEAAAQVDQQAQAEAPPAVEAGIAHRVARELDCAVVAMRYPVADEFAIALAGRLYEGVFELDLPLDRALPRAVAGALAGGPSLARPAISVAVPALVGTRAAGLLLRPPAGKPRLDPAAVRMAAFPPELPRFVGRSRVMAAASAALAPDSGRTGVLFHGMAGAGKTACALELAYRHVGGFAGGLVFWQAPTGSDEFAGALVSLAASLERQLGEHGFAMVDKIGTLEDLRAFLPRLSRLLAEQGLLLVLDNLETLLTDGGAWRDPRWAELVAALTGHDGESRVVLTSRIRPAELDADRVLVEPVHALSRDESVLLARELPHLRKLLHTGPGPARAAADVTADRASVAEVLKLVQGHPKLLELADAAAADRAALATHLAAARTAAGAYQAALPAFFTRGESDLDAAGFVDVLTAWTRSTLATLPDDARLLFELLCLVEEDDRNQVVVAGSWAGLWRRLDRLGDPPEPDTLVASLTGAALVHAEDAGYQIHPGVADAVRTTAPAELRTAVDTTLAAWWQAVAEHAMARAGGEHGRAVVRAGLAAAPYLLRLGDWDSAALGLEQALLRDESPATTQATLPHLRRIAGTTGAIHHTGLLATTLARVDPGEAEQLLRDVLDRAVAAEDFQTASAAGGELVNLLRTTGRLPEALTVLDQKAEHTRRAGLGPWTQLIDQGWRLQIRRLLGESGPVLAEVEALREEMDRLPDPPGPDETVDPWNVREMILNTGVLAARDLDRWQRALDLNADVLAGQRRRHAGPHELARTRFNDYVPLLRLGDLDGTEALLRACQQVFEDQQDLPWLGRVLGARADVAAERGHADEAAAHQRTALRLKYVRPDPRDVAVSHHNLANHLRRRRTDSADRVAHRAAAALIRHLAGDQGDLESVRALAYDLRTLGDQAWLPGSVADLAARVEQVEGVRFTALIHRLAPDPQAAQAALAEIIQTARELPAEQVYDVQGHLRRWQPAIDALVDAAGGDEQAAADVDDLLDDLATADDWRALAGTLRRILAGERDLRALLTGLDPADTAIVRATLDRLGGDPDDPGTTEPVDPVTTVVEGSIHHGD